VSDGDVTDARNSPYLRFASYRLDRRAGLFAADMSRASPAGKLSCRVPQLFRPPESAERFFTSVSVVLLARGNV
jgi:hypothetical protein